MAGRTPDSDAMNGIDDFGHAVGDGIGTVAGRAVDVISGAWDAVATGASAILPGPLLPIAIVAAVVLVVWLVVFRS